MQWCTPMILSFTLLWDKAISQQHYRILRFVSKISCPALTCLNVTQRRLKSFTAPRFTHRPNQFLLSRLEIVEFRWVMRSKTLGSHLTAISLLKLTSTTFVPPHLAFITSEKLGTVYISRSTTERLIQAFVSLKLDLAKAFFTAYPPTS